MPNSIMLTASLKKPSGKFLLNLRLEDLLEDLELLLRQDLLSVSHKSCNNNNLYSNNNSLPTYT